MKQFQPIKHIGENCSITPFKKPKTEFEQEWNRQVSQQQSKIEKVNGRFKDFGLFRNDFKGMIINFLVNFF